jgi:5-methyltetrahydropteroyltriglutamate--homocysteine methyltransferase
VTGVDGKRDRVLEAAECSPLNHVGTSGDGGSYPVGDDTATSRESAFATIRALVEGPRLAERALG